MPLNKQILKAALEKALKQGDQKTSSEEATAAVAKALAEAIDEYVKGGTVSVTVQGVITAGSPSTQTQVAPVLATGDAISGTGGIT
jgi:20S proteasome alpha/beta subunit